MATDDSPSEHHSFQTPVELPAALDRLGIEYLEVHEQRLIVIYNTAVINLEVTDGRITDAQLIVVELWEPPTPGRVDDSDPGVLLEQFIEDIISATEPNEP